MPINAENTGFLQGRYRNFRRTFQNTWLSKILCRLHQYRSMNILHYTAECEKQSFIHRSIIRVSNNFSTTVCFELCSLHPSQVCWIPCFHAVTECGRMELVSPWISLVVRDASSPNPVQESAHEPDPPREIYLGATYICFGLFSSKKSLWGTDYKLDSVEISYRSLLYLPKSPNLIVINVQHGASIKSAVVHVLS